MSALPPRCSSTRNPLHRSVLSALEERLDDLLVLDFDRNTEGEHAPVALDLDRNAREAWIRFCNEHNAQMIELTGPLRAAYAKLEAYCARLALLIQLCRRPNSTTVDLQSVRAAIQLTRWFANEARRLYGLFCGSPGEQQVRELDPVRSRKPLRLQGIASDFAESA